jgi:hypothetical protein
MNSSLIHYIHQWCTAEPLYSSLSLSFPKLATTFLIDPLLYIHHWTTAESLYSSLSLCIPHWSPVFLAEPQNSSLIWANPFVNELLNFSLLLSLMCHEINLTSFSSIICVTFPSTSYIFLHYALFFNISNYIINISDFFSFPKGLHRDGGRTAEWRLRGPGQLCLWASERVSHLPTLCSTGLYYHHSRANPALLSQLRLWGRGVWLDGHGGAGKVDTDRR